VSESYSIWLTPSKEDEAYFSSVIQELADEYDASVFYPHCTLYSPVTDFSLAQSILEKIVLNPIQVTPIGISQSDNIWKTVFIELELSVELQFLKREIESIFLLPYSFSPHISLIYKELADEEKESIISKLDVKNSYKMDAIRIVRTGNTIPNWKTVYTKGLA
jgi:2'-5' RNA ligase